MRVHVQLYGREHTATLYISPLGELRSEYPPARSFGLVETTSSPQINTARFKAMISETVTWAWKSLLRSLRTTPDQPDVRLWEVCRSRLIPSDGGGNKNRGR